MIAIENKWMSLNEFRVGMLPGIRWLALLGVLLSASAWAGNPDALWGQWRGPSDGTACLAQGPGANLELAWKLDMMDPNDDLVINDSFAPKVDSPWQPTFLRADDEYLYPSIGVLGNAPGEAWLRFRKINPATGAVIWSHGCEADEWGQYQRHYQLQDVPLGFRAISQGAFWDPFWMMLDVATTNEYILPELNDSHAMIGHRLLMGKWAWNNRYIPSGTSPQYYAGGKLLWWGTTNYQDKGLAPFVLGEHAWTTNGRCVIFVCSGAYSNAQPFEQARYLELDDQGTVVQDVDMPDIARAKMTASAPGDYMFWSWGVTRIALAEDSTLYALESYTNGNISLARRSISNSFALVGSLFLTNSRAEERYYPALATSFAVDGSRVYLQRHDRLTAYSRDLSNVVWEVATPERTLFTDASKPSYLNAETKWGGMQTLAAAGGLLYISCNDRLQVRRSDTGELAFEHVYDKLPWKRRDSAPRHVPGMGGSLALMPDCVVVSSCMDPTWLWAFRVASASQAPVLMAPSDLIIYRDQPLSVQLKLQKGEGPYTWHIEPTTDDAIRSQLSIDAAGLLGGWTPASSNVGHSYNIDVSVDGAHGSSALYSFRVWVQSGPVTRTLVDFGATAGADVTGVAGLTNRATDAGMTQRSSEGPAGVFVASNPGYSRAWVSGPGRVFQAGEQIRLTLFNRGPSYSRMKAYVSLTSSDRYDAASPKYLPMGQTNYGYVVISSQTNGILDYVVRPEEAGLHTMVNVTPYPRGDADDTNWPNVFIDKIELIGPMEEAPVITALPQSVAVAYNTPAAITLAATNAGAGPLTFTVLAGPTNGTLSGTAPNLTYTPATNYSGPDSFTFRVSDATNTSSATKVSITVAAYNETPVADAQSVTTDEDTAKEITLTGSDGDNDPLIYTIVTSPAHGVLSGTNASRTYTPATNYAGPDSFVFKVNDGKVNSGTATVSITVSPVNDAPVANPQAVSTEEDTATAITLTGSDADGDPLTFTVLAGPTNGVLSGSAPTLTYTPSNAFIGVDGFAFKVNDGIVDSATGMVTLTVYAPEFTAVRDGRFDASDANTWDKGLGIYPARSGVVATIGAYTVTVARIGEVTNGVTVDVSGTGVLRLDNPGSVGSPVHAGAIVNVSTGGVLEANHANVLLANKTVLNGGKLNNTTGADYTSGELNVAGDSVLNLAGAGWTFNGCKVTGGGKLTVTGTSGLPSGTYHLNFANTSTWTGRWNIAAGTVRFNSAYSLPGDLRLASGITVQHLDYYTIKGTRSGFGTNHVYQGNNNPLQIGNGSGNGRLSPGDAGVNGGAGSLAVSTYSANHSATLRMTAGSTYEADICGVSNTQYDTVNVTGIGTGTGNVEVVAGAKLVVNLWTPVINATLDALIINGTGAKLGAGVFDVTWNNTNGWSELGTYWAGPDLHVTGRCVQVVSDSNNNSIPDEWEQQVFGNLTNSATGDNDGDGLDNYGEWMAGTHPTNDTSVFKFTNAVQNAGVGMILRWPSESNRFYTLSLSTNLLLDPFSHELTNRMPANPPENVHTDAVVRPCAFYQVTVTNQ